MQRAAIAVAAAGMIGFGSVSTARAQDTAGQLPALRGGSTSAVSESLVTFAGKRWRVVGEAPVPIRVHDASGKVTLIEGALSIKGGWRGEANYADRDTDTITMAGAPVAQQAAVVAQPQQYYSVVPPQAPVQRAQAPAPKASYNPAAGNSIGIRTEAPAVARTLSVAEREHRAGQRVAEAWSKMMDQYHAMSQVDLILFVIGVAGLALVIGAALYTPYEVIRDAFGISFRRKK
jgi:hypothetical protein